LKGVCKPCVSDGQCGEGGKCNAGRCVRASSDGSDGNDANAGNKGPCKLEPIYFDFNEAQLSQEANQAIERNVECLKKAGSQSVNLVGHTDSRGTEEYNLALSDQRAQSVKVHLTRLGIDPVRLRPVPKGEMDATGTDDSGYVKDRRVDMQW
jgi:peptidoglycan-associated lipoprotein